MGTYVKKTCQNCRYVIQDYKLDNTYRMIDIGVPYEICPNCKSHLIKKNIKEINMMTKFDLLKYWIRNIIVLILSVFITGFIPYMFLNAIFYFKNFIVLIIILALSLIINFMIIITTYNKKIMSSYERLKDGEYVKITELINKNYQKNKFKDFFIIDGKIDYVRVVLLVIIILIVISCIIRALS